MRRFFAGLAAFLVGAVAGWIAAIVVYVVGNEAGLWHDRDGGLAMGFAFVIGPAAGLVAGLLAVAGVVIRMRRREAVTSGE